MDSIIQYFGSNSQNLQDGLCSLCVSCWYQDTIRWRYSTLSRQQYIIWIFGFVHLFSILSIQSLYTVYMFCYIIFAKHSVLLHYNTFYFSFIESYYSITGKYLEDEEYSTGLLLFTVLYLMLAFKTFQIIDITSASGKKELLTVRKNCLAFSTEDVTCSGNLKLDFCQTLIPLQC